MVTNGSQAMKRDIVVARENGHHAKVNGAPQALDPKLNGMNVNGHSADDIIRSKDEAPSASDRDLLKETFSSTTTTNDDSSHARLGSEVAKRTPCRASKISSSASREVDMPFTSKLGQRIWKRYQESMASESGHLARFEVAGLSEDFLRLPIASEERTEQRRSSSRHRPDLTNTDELEQRVMKCHLDLETRSISDSSLMMDETQIETMPSSSLMDSTCFSRVLKRVPYIGLGMSLREYDGCVYIQALLRRDGTRLATENLQDMTGLGPAARAGLLPGDRLLGLNGQPFLKQRIATLTLDEAIDKVPSAEVLKSVGDALSRAKSPVVLHAQRYRERKQILATLKKLADAPQREIQAARSASVNGYRRGPFIHPFAKALSERKLIKADSEELLVTRQIRTLTDRTRQWESKLSFRLRASDHKLRPLLDARDVDPAYYASFVTEDGECPPYFHYKEAKSLHSFAPSTPMIHDWREGRASQTSPAPRVSGEMSREAAVLADLYAGLDENDRGVQDMILGTSGRSASTGSGGVAYPSPDHRGSRRRGSSVDPTDIFVPLMSPQPHGLHDMVPRRRERHGVVRPGAVLRRLQGAAVVPLEDRQVDPRHTLPLDGRLGLQPLQRNEGIREGEGGAEESARVLPEEGLRELLPRPSPPPHRGDRGAPADVRGVRHGPGRRRVEDIAVEAGRRHGVVVREARPEREVRAGRYRPDQPEAVGPAIRLPSLSPARRRGTCVDVRQDGDREGNVGRRGAALPEQVPP
ncbi:hypothetical protein THAOC_12763, partial [Thalassiosira oceanica]